METSLLLSVDPWEMVDEKTGVINKGFSVWFVTAYREDDGKALGLKPAKVSCTQEIYDQIKSSKLPALAQLQVGMRPGAQNKAAPTIVGVTVLKAVDLFSGGHVAKGTAA